MHFETLPGRVGLVTLDRPAALNALDMRSVRLLREGIRAMEADAGIDVIVLTACGERAFCVGVDLKERQRLGDEASRDFAAIHECYAADPSRQLAGFGRKA
ncbi:enoyl-CoA hydratase/isomerase family protein [Variovorax sp. PBL-E5]|uniref:enoyl-CoA hydratase/isomerase family protein n=1 Tax=Variovorax sp. PBL-E5 TaxID=434014 RepID=UPI0013A58682|nr:enoyl-CoA hydratase/isomerase family protein [Variovorax sp. PBL-E5]